MDKQEHHLRTAVCSGESNPWSPASVSLLSRRVLDLASPLHCPSPQGGGATMSDRTPVVLPPGPRVSPSGSWSNSYCTTCLRTRRFLDRPTHLVCETCSKRLEKPTMP